MRNSKFRRKLILYIFFSNFSYHLKMIVFQSQLFQYSISKFHLCIVIFEMPFYRNLGAIRFESQTNHFQIFRAQHETTIFQSKIENIGFILQTQAEFYQNHLNNSHIQFYDENKKNASIVVSQCKQTLLCKTKIDQLCKALLEATKTVKHLSSLFPQHIGDFQVNQFRMVSGKLAFFYFPVKQMTDQNQREAELVKGILSLGAKLKDQTNMSHKLLLKKLTKCKNLAEISEEISYFYSVYGVGSKTTKLPFETKQHKLHLNQRQSKRKLNLFKMIDVTKTKSNHSKLSFHSTSLHSSASRKNTSFNIGIPDKGKSMYKTTSNSCSTRNSPYNQLKFKTIDFNSSFHASQQKKNEQPKMKKSLRKSKVNLCETLNTQVSITDEQKLLKKLNKKKTDSTIKKIESVPSQKQIESIIKSQKQIMALISKDSAKVVQQSSKVIPESNPVSVKFPTNVSQHIQPIPQIKAVSSKAIHKHESIHISQSNIQSIPQSLPQTQQINPQQSHPQQPQPQPKKLKKKPIKEQEWGSEIEIVDLTQQSKDLPIQASHKMNETKQLNIPKNSKQKQINDLSDGVQTKKNSWNAKPAAEQKIKTNKLLELRQRKYNLDFMGQTVVNTAGYLKNYEKIFWQLPLFFIYRAFYVLRSKLARQIQPFQENQAFKELTEENKQIGIAVNKMAKMITKKLKMVDPNLLQNIKEFLSTDENLNCDAPMKSFLGQYIRQLIEASSDYQQLLYHEIEVVDSYLIAKGNNIDQKKKKILTYADCHAYLKVQLQKLKQYL